MADFVDAMPQEDLLDECTLVVDVGGREVAIVRTGGEVYAIQNDCPHAGSPLGEGDVTREGVVECPGHGAEFNVVTGDVERGPATEPIETYDVEIVDGMIRVAID